MDPPGALVEIVLDQAAPWAAASVIASRSRNMASTMSSMSPALISSTGVSPRCLTACASRQRKSLRLLSDPIRRLRRSKCRDAATWKVSAFAEAARVGGVIDGRRWGGTHSPRAIKVAISSRS